jgi:hypothetical protein
MVGDPHALLTGAEQRGDQVPRHEPAAAGHCLSYFIDQKELDLQFSNQLKAKLQI